MRACRRETQVAVNYDVILFSTANGDAGGPLIHQQLRSSNRSRKRTPRAESE
jgi:hypothetical protein